MLLSILKSCKEFIAKNIISADVWTWNFSAQFIEEKFMEILLIKREREREIHFSIK